MEYPRISVVTPNYNGERFLEETIKSVLDQNYPNLEYIIIDGGSTDDSLNIIKKYEHRISYWESKKDEGIYDALNKGFAKTSGEVMGYLNSDDMLHVKSLYTLAEIFMHPEVDWVQGVHSWFDEKGRTYQVEKVRLRSKYSYLMKEYHAGFSSFIQQESTYWRRSLWERAGGFISTKFKVAGDFELWMRFFKYAQMFLSDSLIGGFRRTVNQLSVINHELYFNEADAIVDSYLLLPEEIENLIFLSEKRIIDKLPYLRRNRFLRRQNLIKEMKTISWNADRKKFQIL